MLFKPLNVRNMMFIMQSNKSWKVNRYLQHHNPLRHNDGQLEVISWNLALVFCMDLMKHALGLAY